MIIVVITVVIVVIMMSVLMETIIIYEVFHFGGSLYAGHCQSAMNDERGRGHRRCRCSFEA